MAQVNGINDDDKIKLFENLSQMPNLKEYVSETCYAQAINGFQFIQVPADFRTKNDVKSSTYEVESQSQLHYNQNVNLMQEYKIVSQFTSFISGLVAGATLILSFKHILHSWLDNENIINNEGAHLKYILSAATAMTYLVAFLSVSDLYRYMDLKEKLKDQTNHELLANIKYSDIESKIVRLRIIVIINLASLILMITCFIWSVSMYTAFNGQITDPTYINDAGEEDLAAFDDYAKQYDLMKYMLLVIFFLQMFAGTFGNTVYNESARDQSETILQKIDVTNIKPIS